MMRVILCVVDYSKKQLTDVGSCHGKLIHRIHSNISLVLTFTMMTSFDNISVTDSFLENITEHDDQSQDNSLPTFQMFREKKNKVESELKYHYR